jgi:hypothetical protein
MDFINYIGPFDFITLIDLKAAYQRFRCAEHCVHFRWRGDYYVFLKAFFGVKTMLAKFQRVVDAICHEAGFGKEYFDDIGLEANSFEEGVELTVRMIK